MDNEVGQIQLVWDWPIKVRRNEIGFAQIKQRLLSRNNSIPYQLNFFLYAFLCPAKNLDLFLTVTLTTESLKKYDSIREKLNAIEKFERTGIVDSRQENVTSKWLEIRNVAARTTARDEQRTLATLLFSGPSTAEEIATDLGISVNLVKRVLQSIQSVLKTLKPGDEYCQLDTESDSLSATLYLLRSTLGLDPVAILKPMVDKAVLCKSQ